MGKGIMKVLIVDDPAIVRERLIIMFSKITEAENTSYAEDLPKAIRGENSYHRVHIMAVGNKGIVPDTLKAA